MDWTETPATLARARAEQPVTFAGPEGLLAGIYTPAAPETRCANRCIIFAARPRFATRRLAVLAARALAAEGFAGLRFDFHGHGESAGNTISPDRKQPYGGVVAAAIRYMRETHAQHRFLLVGYCFDALSALDAFRGEADAIDGLFFAAAPVLTEPLAVSESISERNGNGNGISQPLRRSLSPWWRIISTVLPGPRGDQRAAEVATDSRPPQISSGVESAIAALARSRARALFLYGEHEPFYAEFKLVERRLFARLDEEARDRLRVELWPSAVHSIESEPAILDRVVSWAREFQARPENEPRHPDSGAILQSTE
jgi:alpha/beta superfamily hydrolase